MRWLNCMRWLNWITKPSIHATKAFLHIKKKLSYIKKDVLFKKNLSKNTLIIVVVVIVCLALQYNVSQWCATVPPSPRSLLCSTTRWRRRDQQPCLCYVRLCTAATRTRGGWRAGFTPSLILTQTNRQTDTPRHHASLRDTHDGLAQVEPRRNQPCSESF